MKLRIYFKSICVAIFTAMSGFSVLAEDIPDDYVYIPMVEEGKAWHYSYWNWTYPPEDSFTEYVKLVLQGDVEWEGQTWKQCWFMTEDDKLLAKKPVVLLREENKIVYIYPLVNSSTYFSVVDDSGKLIWSHPQIHYFMTYFKNYIDLDVEDHYPIESPEEINEVYPAVLYDFNMNTGDSLEPLAASHWAYIKHICFKREYVVDDIQYESNCLRTYKKLNLIYDGLGESTPPAIYEGIGYMQEYGHYSYFICPNPTFGTIPSINPEAQWPVLLSVTDKEGEVIFKNPKYNTLSISGTESENAKLYCADGKLIITGSGNELYSISLYDMRGNTLYKGNISVDSPVYVSDKLLPGIYIAVAEGAGCSSRLKFEVKGR